MTKSPFVWLSDELIHKFYKHEHAYPIHNYLVKLVQLGCVLATADQRQHLLNNTEN